MLFFQFIVLPHNYLLRNCYLQQLLAGLKAIISHPNPQLRRKNQRRHTGDEIRKNKASTSHETKDRKAENGRTPEDSESSGKVILDDWESSHDKKDEAELYSSVRIMRLVSGLEVFYWLHN
jgi:hypothetical protein